MWQSPNQRVRAIAQAKKRERDRLLQPMHFRRVEGELKLITQESEAEIVIPVRLVLNDLSPKGMELFATQPLVTGQELIAQVKEPKELIAKAKVVVCQEYENDGHILSPRTYPYRMVLKFIFESPEQEKILENFCREISQEYLYGQKAA